MIGNSLGDQKGFAKRSASKGLKVSGWLRDIEYRLFKAWTNQW